MEKYEEESTQESYTRWKRLDSARSVTICTEHFSLTHFG